VGRGPAIGGQKRPDAGRGGLAAPPENWEIRKTTNSAGFTGAMPTSTISWPRSITSGGFVSESHLT
jgi:hypothetical protein